MKNLLGASALALLILSGSAQAATLGYWRFESGSANAVASGVGSIQDDGPSSIHGTPVGDPIYRSNVPASTVPKTGAANSLSLELDGNDFVSIAHSGALNPLFKFTVELWLRGSTNQPEGLFLVADKSHGFVDSTGWFLQGDRASGSIGFGVGNGGAGAGDFPATGSTTNVLDSDWHHVAGVYDSTDTGKELKLYIDGILESVAAAGPYVSNNRSINIGAALGPGFPLRHFNGLVDEFRISDTALAPSEFLMAPVPIPAALPLMAGGLGLLGIAGWRRKRAAAA